MAGCWGGGGGANILSISEQTIDRALTIHIKKNYESIKKNYFISLSPHTKTIHWL